MTPEQFNLEVIRLAAQAWDSGFCAGLDYASSVIGDKPAERVVNPYSQKERHVADHGPE